MLADKRFVIEEPANTPTGWSRRDVFGGPISGDNGVFMYLGTARIISRLSGMILPDRHLHPFDGMTALDQLAVGETMLAYFDASEQHEEYYVRRVA